MSYERDPNELEERCVKLHACSEIVIETCHEHNLTVKLIRPEKNSTTIVLAITATRAQFREAQMEWLRRMCIGATWDKSVINDNAEIEL